MNIFVQNFQIYFDIRLFAQNCFGLFWPFSYVVLFWTHIEPFWTKKNHFKPFLRRKKFQFKYIHYHRYWTNVYPNIFVSIKRS